MTREKAIEALLHEMRGHVLDAVLKDRKGADLSLWLKSMTETMSTRIIAILDAYKPIPKPAPPQQAPPTTKK